MRTEWRKAAGSNCYAFRAYPGFRDQMPHHRGGAFLVVWSSRQESNLRPTVYETVALPFELQERFGARSQNRTGVSRLQDEGSSIELSRQLEPPDGIELSSMRYQRIALPLS
jgi:hypothetical protein